MTQAEPLTPAQAEQQQYDTTRGVLAIRDNQFSGAPQYLPREGEWAALKEMARSLCITEFVPKEMRGRPFAVLGALLMGRDLGLPATMALRRIYVVNGRPALEGAVKVALVRRAGHRIRVLSWDAEHCKVQGWRRGDPVDEVMEVTYTMDDARIAGDYDKPGDTYKKRPKQMMLWRAEGLLCDTYFSDVTLGLPEPEDVADLPSEVIEVALAERDRRGELPAMPSEIPLTDAEREARMAEGQQQAQEALRQSSEPPPPPRTRRRGRGPEPVPQTGSDSGGEMAPSDAAPAGSPEPAATPAPPSAPAVSDAEMARGLGLEEEAQALERGEGWRSTEADRLARDAEARRGAETAATEPRTPPATPAAPPPAAAPVAQAPAAGDPFGGEAAAAPPDDLGVLRQRAETYADFLMRRKLERAGQAPKNVEDLHRQALGALELIAKQMLGHAYLDASATEMTDKLLPWLRKRYGDEGGTE